MTDACGDRHSDIIDALTGRLSTDRQAEFAAHTTTCDACAQELRELGAVSSLLQHTDIELEAVARPLAPPPDLGARIAIAVERARVEEARASPAPVLPLEKATRARTAPRPGRSRRIAVAVLGAAAAVVVTVAAIGALRDSSPGPAAEVVDLAAQDIAPTASATAELRPESYGTAIDLTVAGLDEGNVYALWLADASGERTPAGTFVAGSDGTASLETRTALAREVAIRIWITDPADATVLVAPLTGRQL